MKDFRSLLFCATIMIVLGCETARDINIGLNPPKIVLNSIMSSDSDWSVSLTKTINVTDAAISGLPVENAEVAIYDANNSFIEKLTVSTNFMTRYLFRGKTKPSVGESYEVRALVDGSITSAKAAVPENVPIKTYELDSSLYKADGGNVRMKITVNDPPGISNYYSIKIIRNFYYIVKQDTIRSIEYVGVEMFDPTHNEFSQTAVNDNLFDGKAHDFDFKVDRFSYGGEEAVTEKLQVQLLNISEEYYEYLTTVDLQKDTRGDPFSQPTLIFSNIENGTGILGAYNASTINLK